MEDARLQIRLQPMKTAILEEAKRQMLSYAPSRHECKALLTTTVTTAVKLQNLCRHFVTGAAAHTTARQASKPTGNIDI